MSTITRFVFFLLLIFLLARCGVLRKNQVTSTEVIITSADAQPPRASTLSSEKPVAVVKAEDISRLQAKYAKQLHTIPDSIKNIRLYSFIEEWWGTPYLWGGETKAGIDCSAFVRKLYENVYNVYLPRTAETQFFTDYVDRFSSMSALEEGDLIFFKTMKGRAITHVGMYLGNGMFVNSSSREGVSIGDLRSDYWRRNYAAAGRIKPQYVRAR